MVAGLDICKNIRDRTRGPTGMNIAYWDSVGIGAYFRDGGDVITIWIAICRSGSICWINYDLKFDTRICCESGEERIPGCTGGGRDVKG